MTHEGGTLSETGIERTRRFEQEDPGQIFAGPLTEGNLLTVRAEETAVDAGRRTVSQFIGLTPPGQASGAVELASGQETGVPTGFDAAQEAVNPRETREGVNRALRFTTGQSVTNFNFELPPNPVESTKDALTKLVLAIVGIALLFVAVSSAAKGAGRGIVD